ncbi:MAG TPA: hypothetical protein PLU45_00190 [Bacteroidales bacterium]|nr:hypothetical protein [Bacteroidales bacterium]
MKTSIVPYRFFILLFAALFGVIGGVSAQDYDPSFCGGASFESVQTNVSGNLNGQNLQGQCIFIASTTGNVNLTADGAYILVNGASTSGWNPLFPTKVDDGYYLYFPTNIWTSIDVVSGTPIFSTNPKITVSTSSLSNFTYCNDSGPSVAQSFTVSGTNLTDNISITPPAGYEISLTSGGPYQTSSLTLTESEGAVPATTVYVRLKSDLETGEKTGNIEITSTDADNKTVALTGEVAGAVITVSNATLSGFSYCDGHGPSNWQSYTVSGVCLSENITI